MSVQARAQMCLVFESLSTPMPMRFGERLEAVEDENGVVRVVNEHRATVAMMSRETWDHLDRSLR